MKFSEMPYSRPDIEAIRGEYDEIIKEFNSAKTADGQIDAIQKHEKLCGRFSTLATIVSIRNSVNTSDEFYNTEMEYMDEISPLFEEKSHEFLKAVLSSEFRPLLEKRFGTLLFKNLEISARSFSSEIIGLMQEENKLVSAYQKLYGSALIEFDGQKLPLPMMAKYCESPDREVREKAYKANSKFFEEHSAELDELYDKLVKNRDAQAKKLGYENYIGLGYDRLGRNCYGQEKVRAFRESIARDVVSGVGGVKELQRKRIGVDKLTVYDDKFTFTDGNVKPVGTADDILKAGKEMYHGLSPETAEFIDFMYDNELLDVLSKEGKAPGGYCTFIHDYKSPFIFSNFNGTSGDVDVLTHEAGHAFAAYRSADTEIAELSEPTIEACECHSMSMEFLTSAYHKLFFGAETDKYELSHAEDSLCFIPYGCQVDEFQHMMYENPSLTPKERNEIWLSLDKKFRPYLDHGGIPMYENGAGWQRQLHIYMYPLYYIDYCMAQTIAFQFWLSSLKDGKDTWNRYLGFVDAGGRKTFEQLVTDAGLKLPYSDGAMKEVCGKVGEWISEHQLG